MKKKIQKLFLILNYLIMKLSRAIFRSCDKFLNFMINSQEKEKLNETVKLKN